MRGIPCGELVVVLQPGHRACQQLGICEDGPVERFTQSRLVEVDADECEFLTESQQFCAWKRIDGQR